MSMLLIETLNKNYKIRVFLVYLLLIVNINIVSIIFGLILKLDILSFRLLITALISFFTSFWIHLTTNVLNLLFFFNDFSTLFNYLFKK